MAVVYSQFTLHQWKTSLKVGKTNVLEDKSIGIVNSEATIHALCFLSSYLFKQVSIQWCIWIADVHCCSINI